MVELGIERLDPSMLIGRYGSFTSKSVLRLCGGVLIDLPHYKMNHVMIRLESN